MPITITGDRCALRFPRFDQDAYELFLKAKRIPEFRILTDSAGIAEGLDFPARFAHLIGERIELKEEGRLPMPDFLFDDQRAIVDMALSAKRFAVWKDTGLGKTLEQLEWCRQVAHITGKRVLLVTLPNIIEQTIEEARKFYGDSYRILRLETREEMRQWCAGLLNKGSQHKDQSVDAALPCSEADAVHLGPGHNGEAHAYSEHRPNLASKDCRANPLVEFQIAITNYEKFNPDGLEVIDELRHLGGIALDESSRLKTGGGKQKWAIIKSSRGIPYKSSFTATPAPNDVMEFASQASFLERIRDENDVIWTYFTRDPVTNEWTVKKHARPHFFRWMASWSIYVADPRAYGWRMNMEDVPQPQFFYEEIAPTAEQMRLLHAKSAENTEGTGELFGDKRLGMVNQLTLLEAAKGFVYRKPGYIQVKSKKPAHVARTAKAEVDAGRQTLIWCEYDAEVELLACELANRGVPVAAIGGDTPQKKRQSIIEDFRHGKIPLLVSKAKLLGWGQNFQCCSAMIFSGFSDSFESFYQAVRRAYRYGQKDSLRVFIPYVPQLEGPVLRNLLNKVGRFKELIRDQETAYIEARRELQ